MDKTGLIQMAQKYPVWVMELLQRQRDADHAHYSKEIERLQIERDVALAALATELRESKE